MISSTPVKRCHWCTDVPIYQAYHDHEWGKPITDDRMLFEQLCLEGQQAGLSWLTVLKRRQAYRDAFYAFDINRLAVEDDDWAAQHNTNTSLIRHPKKLQSIVHHARLAQTIIIEYGSLYAYIQSMIQTQPLRPYVAAKLIDSSIPALQLSANLKKRGFVFVGPRICHAYLQAIGVFNHHDNDCDFRQHRPLT
jgi:DNA-3-methyladenine glycosylase I